MLRPIKINLKGKEVILACTHWRNFPPVSANQDIVVMKRMGELTDAMEQQHRVWEKVCGLTQMDEVKCKGCNLVRLLEHLNPHQPPQLVTMDRKHSTPAIDIPSIEGKGKFRGNLIHMTRKPGERHSSKNAAWLDAVLAAEKEAQSDE